MKPRLRHAVAIGGWLLGLTLIGPAFSQRQTEEPSYKGKTVSDWASAITQKNEEARLKAFDELTGPDESAIPVLEVLAKAKDPYLQNASATALASLGKKAKPAMKTLISLLNSRSLNARYWACSALASMGQDAVQAVPALTECLMVTEKTQPDLVGPKRYYADLRAVASETLGGMGLLARDAIPTLERLAGSPDESPEVQGSASRAIDSILKSIKESETGAQGVN